MLVGFGLVWALAWVRAPLVVRAVCAVLIASVAAVLAHTGLWGSIRVALGVDLANPVVLEQLEHHWQRGGGVRWSLGGWVVGWLVVWGAVLVGMTRYAQPLVWVVRRVGRGVGGYVLRAVTVLLCLFSVAVLIHPPLAQWMNTLTWATVEDLPALQSLAARGVLSREALWAMVGLAAVLGLMTLGTVAKVLERGLVWVLRGAVRLHNAVEWSEGPVAVVAVEEDGRGALRKEVEQLKREVKQLQEEHAKVAAQEATVAPRGEPEEEDAGDAEAERSEEDPVTEEGPTQDERATEDEAPPEPQEEEEESAESGAK